MFKQVRRRTRSVYATGAVTAGLLIAAAVVAVQLIGNPFATTTVDRSLPPLLTESTSIRTNCSMLFQLVSSR